MSRVTWTIFGLSLVAKASISHLAPAIAAKRAFRAQEAAGIQETILSKEARLKALWSARLSNQMAVAPPCDQVFREFHRALRLSSLP